MDPAADCLIIFVKYPEPGLVKTRLAKDIGNEKATVLYKSFVETILRATDDNNFKRIIFYTPPDKKDEMNEWLGNDIEMYPQKGSNLGERLYNAFRFTFDEGAKKAVVIGTDSPLLDKKIALEAFKELDKNECVIGPAADGGYYLLGLSRLCREIFHNIDWGTDKVYSQTLQALKGAGLGYCALEENFDIDEAADLKKLPKILLDKMIPL